MATVCPIVFTSNICLNAPHFTEEVINDPKFTLKQKGAMTGISAVHQQLMKISREHFYIDNGLLRNKHHFVSHSHQESFCKVNSVFFDQLQKMTQQWFMQSQFIFFRGESERVPDPDSMSWAYLLPRHQTAKYSLRFSNSML